MPGVADPTVRKIVTRVGKYMLIGSGDPNGDVDAPFSAMFHRMDGAAGSSVYVKETAEGSMVGWRAL